MNIYLYSDYLKTKSIMTMVSEIQKIQSIKWMQKLSSLLALKYVLKAYFENEKDWVFIFFFFGILAKHKHSELKDIRKCHLKYFKMLLPYVFSSL